MTDADHVKEEWRCPLCNHPLREPLQGRMDRNRFLFYPVECEVCGTYSMEEIVFLTHALVNLPRDIKLKFSAVIRRHYEFSGHPKKITLQDCEELAFQTPTKNDVPTKVRYLLAYIAHKSHFPGEWITLRGQTDYPICFAANIDEFGYYAQFIKEAGFVDGQRHEKPADKIGDYQYWLTPKGWEEVKRVPTFDSPYAFVAMSFDKGNTRLTQAFNEAIKPAIEDDAGYQEALRVDRKEFLGDIVFEIIARIKESRFVIADVTQHRNGVYYEAGYAMGMGLPVIWMCHKDDMGKAHFDTSHMNHIVWDDIGELRRNLANRILATIGRGPKK
jgi:hypothetical protein